MTVLPELFLAALLIGLSKGGLAGALGGLVVPLLSTVMPVSQAVGLTLPLLMIGDVFALRAFWRQWDGRLLQLLLPAAVIGILAGVALLTRLPDVTLRRILGLFTLVAVAYKLGSDRLRVLRYTPHPWHGALAGGLSGFASALANAGGPPITIYLLLQRLTPLVFLGTNALFFAIVNVIKLPFFLGTSVINADQLLGTIWALPLIPVGVWLSKQLMTRINRQAFEWLMLALLTYSGFSLLLR
ncbi:MAG: sulfite exporter TauE/SafE family protein [Anaerolineae bacterium]|nr:sulfite exporter TauE/SafE family protein [Anaerolineae bacterium]